MLNESVYRAASICLLTTIGAEVVATKHFSVKKKDFSVKGGRHLVNEGFGKDFYKKGNSMKRSWPFNEPLDSETEKLLSKPTSPKSAPK